MGYRLHLCREVRVRRISHVGRLPFSYDLVSPLFEHSKDERAYSVLVHGFDLKSKYLNIVAQSVRNFGLSNDRLVLTRLGLENDLCCRVCN